MTRMEFLKENVSKEIYEDVVSFLNISANIKYDYLAISYEYWEKLIVNITLDILKKEPDVKFFGGVLSRSINLTVKKYIKAQIARNDTTVLNNLLLKLKRNVYDRKRVLRDFIYELEFLEIYFDEGLFNLLKNTSFRFKNLLKGLKIENISFNDLKKYLALECNFEIKNVANNTPKIDYKYLSLKYNDLSFEKIRNLLGADFDSLSSLIQNLIKKYFIKVDNHYGYDIEKELNLLEFNYKRKDINVDINKLRKVYLENKDKFNLEQSLFLECFIFGLQEMDVFNCKYPNPYTHEDYLLKRLEILYYGIDDIFEFTLTKEQYLEVLAKYPSETKNFRKDILDDYYGVNGGSLSISELSKKHGIINDEMRHLVQLSKRYCLSLYCNLNLAHIVDKDKYIPYILDAKYEIRKDLRDALYLYLIEGKTYEEISKIMPKKDISELISVGLRKVDEYRFGIVKIEEQDKNIEDIEITESDILEEVNRHISESVISELDKRFISYYYGLKTKYNLKGEQIRGKALLEKINYKGRVFEKYKFIIDRIKSRKAGYLNPSLIFIERNKLEKILSDEHLPITTEDRYVICSLLEIKGYPLKSIHDLALEMDISDNSVRKKYRAAIININKYLNDEKSGTITFKHDIIPNLKYFTFKERELLEDYYANNLSNKEIAKKYNIPPEKVKAIMYRLKTYLIDIIKNPQVVRFDYDYYYQVVDEADFPFRGDLKLAKEIFSLYVGENSLVKMDINEIKQKLGLEINTRVISQMIDRLVLGVFKYQDGIRKEYSFTSDDVRDYYVKNKEKLTSTELALIQTYFNKDINYHMNNDLIFMLIKDKYPNYIKLAELSLDRVRELLKKYDFVLSDNAKLALMSKTNISYRDLMSEEEKKLVFDVLAQLDQKLQDKKELRVG